jgi:hypothetical protein
MIVSQLRIEDFGATVSDRLGPLAGDLVKRMMRNSVLHGKSASLGNTETLTVGQIISLLGSGQSGNIDQNKIRLLLEDMSNDSLKPIKKHKSTNEEMKYSVNLASILYFSQSKMVESLLETKFGSKHHVRVYRATQALGVVSEKQLEDTCLLSVKVVRKILLDLTVEGIVEQLEVNLNKGVYAYSVKLSGYLPILRERILKVELGSDAVQAEP